jgi:RHS repeat-associated protein
VVTHGESFDELYHGGGTGGGYDNLNQLTNFKRGTLNGSNNDIASPTRTQNWTLDALGNWDPFTTNGTAQDRDHNKQNQVTQVGTANLTFDATGNTTTDETGKTLTYDAWNRLISINTSPSLTYAYDALGRRTVEDRGGTMTDFYYSAAWQVLEDRVSGQAKSQYLWSPVYIDGLILRDRDANGQTGDGLEERIYAMQDANWNITGIMNPSGQVLERYVYDPYGTPTRLTASWTTPGSDTNNWVYLHQGGRYEAASGLYQFRNRELSAGLGRWMQVDPIGFRAGDSNFFRYVKGNSIGYSDPLGLCVATCELPFGKDYYGTTPCIPSEEIGGGMNGSLGFESPSRWTDDMKNALKQAASSICKCIKKALDALGNHYCAAKKMFADHPQMNNVFKPGNAVFYVDKLQKALKKCESGHTNFFPLLKDDGKGGIAYVPGVAWPWSDKVHPTGNTIYIYPRAFQKGAEDLADTVGHEIGRLLGISGNDGDSTNNIYHWNNMIRILCKHHDSIKASEK